MSDEMRNPIPFDEGTAVCEQVDAIKNDQVNGSATFLVTELRKSIDKLEELLHRKA